MSTMKFRTKGVPKGLGDGAYKLCLVALGPTNKFQDKWSIEPPADGQPIDAQTEGKADWQAGPSAAHSVCTCVQGLGKKVAKLVMVTVPGLRESEHMFSAHEVPLEAPTQQPEAAKSDLVV
eukprot:479548-Pelagomonas_calceolata.AAC.1